MDSFILSIGLLIIVCIIVIFAMLRVYGSFLRKVGPNEALIVYGTGGTKVIVGGAFFVLPLYQRARLLSLELMSFDLPLVLDPSPGQESKTNVHAVALIKVRSDSEGIVRAAERFLSKSQQEREHLVRLVIEGHLYGINNRQEREHLVRLAAEGHLQGISDQLSSEEQEEELEISGTQMLKAMTADLERMGLEMVSFTLKEVPKEGARRLTIKNTP